MKVYLLTGIVLLLSFETAQTENSNTDKSTTLSQNRSINWKSAFTGKAGNHLIKYDPVAIQRGHLTLGYERIIHETNSMNFQVGFVVPDWHGYNSVKTNYTLSNSWHAKGVFVKAGYRFYQSPMWNLSSENADATFYVEPEITIGQFYEELVFGYNNTEYYTKGTGTLRNTPIIFKKNIRTMALTFNTGAQFKFMEKWVAECFFGVGLGWSTKLGDINYDDRGGFSTADNHAFIGPFYNMPFVFSGGLKIGMMIY